MLSSKSQPVSAHAIPHPREGAQVRSRRWKRPKLPILLSLVWLLGITVAALLAGPLSPESPTKQNLRARNVPPFWMSDGSWDHPLGTDQVGYDVLSRLLFGARPALEIGATAAVISLIIGTLLGLTAGYFRGPLDTAIMMLADAQLSLPFIVIALAAVAAFGQSMLLLIVLAGISSWMGFARTVRSQVLTLRRTEFVTASQAAGGSSLHVLFRHLLPNLSSLIIVLVTIQIRGMILFEASMSFLGLGVPPPQPSWGSMISSGRDYLLNSWWISVVPGIALMLTVLSASRIGDWLRDTLDPNLRNIR